MIEIENLTKYYGDLLAIDDITFSVKKGEVLGLLGPNGAGKTTTMRILTGYLNPSSGGVRVKEMDVASNPRSIKKLMGYLPENAPLYPDMLVYDYLNYMADIRHLGKSQKTERVAHLVDICGIRSVMHQPIGELSKGFNQRVGLAQAMMGDPEILVLDEPTSGLDPNQIIEIREIIKEIGREKTVILSTHILSEAEATCDRVVIINKGKIAADAGIGDLKQEVGRETHLRLVLKDAVAADVEKAMSAIAGIKAVRPQPVEEKGVVHMDITCDPAESTRTEIYGAVKGREWTLLEFTPQARSLEHIFRELTKEN